MYYLTSCKNQDNDLLESINTKREKGLNHNIREYRQIGDISYRKIFTIWASKLFLVEKTINDNPFSNSYFAWVDATVSRFDSKRENNFLARSFGTRHLYHYKSPMFFYGKRLPVNASFMLAHKKIFEDIIGDYRSELENSKYSNYAHDEETILGLIYEKNARHFRRL